MDGYDLRCRLLGTLPASRGGLTLRMCERSDMDLLARWPAYPEPHHTFAFSFAGLSASEMDSFYDERRRQDYRIVCVVDHGPALSIGYIALLDIDWERRQCGTMAIRVHPELCDKGIGVEMLTILRDWWFSNGMGSLRLDVAGSNARAVRCYEKVGFVKIGEFWREAPDLKGLDLSAPEWRFLDGHVRPDSGGIGLRFLLMELSGPPGPN